MEKTLLKLLKLIKLPDWLIAGSAMLMMLGMDFHNVTWHDCFYLAVILMWFLMLVVRLYMQMRQDDE